MNSSEINESDDIVEPEKMAFGDIFLQTREAKGYSIIEVAKATHLGEAMIDAIEKSDLKRLPPPSFVQGYLRTYARYLELSEQAVVENFNRAVPYKRESQLHPRVSLPAQASSHSPLIRGVSLLLLVFVIIALVYGAYDYYARKAITLGLEKANVSVVDAAEVGDNIQHSVISEDGELIVVAPARLNDDAVDQEKAPEVVAGSVEQNNAKPAVDVPAPDSVVTAKEVITPAVAAVDTSAASDVIELHAYDESWVEIVDAANHRLHHNLIQNEQILRLKGVAPFTVFLGNAPAIELQVNGLEVNMNRYIRTNNVARFSVSTRDGNVVFR